ncbi:MAG: AAA family ATPase, partial [Candidatus Poseidoniales archaeon]
MITFKKIRWKNFLSTGNQWTEVLLDEHKNTMIIGTNGAGKSTILDALTFSLFNKPFRKINKPQLVNSVNEKDCQVEVEFDIKNKEYKIVRGLKPAKFEIWIDGELQDQDASAVDQQKKLEQNILKLNFKSFTQIVILGSSTFVPFMQLPTAHRREVIEDLLDIKIFSSMNVLIKDKIRSIREETRTLELKRDSLKDKLKMQKEFIEQIEQSSKNDIKEKKEQIKNIAEEANKYIITNTRLVEEIDDLERVNIWTPDTLKKLTSLRTKIQTKRETVNEETAFFNDHSVCPTCTQSIEEEFRLNRIGTLNASIEKLNEGLTDLDSKIEEEEKRESQYNELSKEVTSLNNEVSQNTVRVSGLQRQCRNLESEIQRITDQLANRNSEHEKLNDFNETLQGVYEDLATKTESVQNHDFAYSLLKDGGVKTKIIKQYLPLINKQVNRYLQLMDFFINFQLDEEFNESVQSPIHDNFSYASFSEGEKMRIDLALLFTWREVAAFKNSVSTNLLIMDEVFDSSLDGLGTEEFLKIIRYVISNANVFIISHKESLFDKFENVLRFEKVKG